MTSCLWIIWSTKAQWGWVCKSWTFPKIFWEWPHQETIPTFQGCPLSTTFSYSVYWLPQCIGGVVDSFRVLYNRMEHLRVLKSALCLLVLNREGADRSNIMRRTKRDLNIMVGKLGSVTGITPSHLWVIPEKRGMTSSLMRAINHKHLQPLACQTTHDPRRAATTLDAGSWQNHNHDYFGQNSAIRILKAVK